MLLGLFLSLKQPLRRTLSHDMQHFGDLVNGTLYKQDKKPCPILVELWDPILVLGNVTSPGIELGPIT